MEHNKLVFSGRRWLVLGALMAVTMACEAEWLVHAAVARAATAFYAGQVVPGSLWSVDLLALVYMVVYLVLSVPASAVLHRRGLGVGVGIGAVLTILGSVVKAAGAGVFGVQVGGQVILAAAQPFLINAATTLAREWFPAEERATASGLATLAQYLGFVVALGLTPLVVQVDPLKPGYGQGLEAALVLFAVVSAVAGALALLGVRQGPLAGVKDRTQDLRTSLHALWQAPHYRRTFLLFLLGLGVLNALSSLTDTVAASLGVQDSDGLLGVGLIGGGILGALALPWWSDRVGRRRPFLVGGMAGGALALGLLVVGGPGGYALAVAAMAALGFFLLGTGPVGFQYAAETTAPVPEALSQGVLLWAGQVSGLVLTGAMATGGPGTMGWWLAGCGVILGFLAWGASTLTEAPGRGPTAVGPVSSTTTDTPSASAEPPTRERA